MDSSQHPFYCTYSPNIPQLLMDLNCTLAISTYQAGKLIFISPQNEHQLIQLPRDFKKAMGVATDGRRMAVACKNEVVVLSNATGLSRDFPPKPRQYDALYMPRATYYTGEVDVHDMHWCGQDLIAVISRFSCLAKIGDHFSIDPIWKPNFVTHFVPTDLCHLNGMAVENDRPKYVTAFGTTNSPKGWRPGIMTGGVVIDVDSQELIAQGLPMPHSPRLFDGKLFVLLSATGELVEIDPATGKLDVVIQLPGFVRGMCKWHDYLFIGLSRIRQSSSVFRDLPIRFKEVNCGIEIVHLPTGLSAGSIRYMNDVEELYDIQVLPGMLRPGILNHTNEMHRLALNTPEADFWSEPQAEIGHEQ